MHIIWFKRDLRIHDHQPLAEAGKHYAIKNEPVLCLYIVEPDYWQLPDTSARQWLSIAESLKELDAELFEAYGIRLTIRTGDAVEVLKNLNSLHPVMHLYSHEETGNLWTFNRDIRVGKFCRDNNIPWTEYRQFGVFRCLKNRDKWASLWQDFMDQPLIQRPAELKSILLEPSTIPALEDLKLASDHCPHRQKGGRRLGLKCLNSFFEGRGAKYQFEMSSPLTARSACSRLSLHIALGTLSMREILHKTQEKQQEMIAIPSEFRSMPLRAISAFVGRLHWHCHFIQKLESEPEIENRSVHPIHERERQKLHNETYLQAWANGQTGYPFVDACMRSLIQTGWINFRMRAMMMSFASYHLNLDWTKSGAVLARLFTDYEPGIHWPQIQMQSGQTGINVPRMYNPVKQSHDQDSEGAFIRKWIPELANLPLVFIHEPWLMSDAERMMHSIHYPCRIIDHEIAAKQARERLSAIRRLEDYRQVGQRVYQKHGSRRKPSERPRPAKPLKPKDKQMGFDL